MPLHPFEIGEKDVMRGDVMTDEELIETCGLFGSMYLCKPSREAIENWTAMLSEDTSVFLHNLNEAVAEINTSSNDELEELLWEYTRLFIGPYRLPCPPWESVYASPKRSMMQDAADQVLTLYRKAGLAVNTDDVMPDHIGVELNFLALLLSMSKSGAADREHLTALTYNLLDDHLMKWLPDFTHDMENAAETRLYKTLARATRDLVDFFGR